MDTYFKNELSKIISKFKNIDNSELEYHFSFKNLEKMMFEKIFNNLNNNNILHSIEQHVNVLYTDSRNMYNTYRLTKQFKNGVNINNDINILKKSLNKPLLFKSNVENILSISLHVNKEQSLNKLPNNLNMDLIILKLRISFTIKELPNWRYDLDLIKELKPDSNNIQEYKNKLLFSINIDNFLNKLPYNFVDKLSLEIEYIGDKNELNYTNIQDPINYLYNIITPNYKYKIVYQNHIYKIATHIIKNKYLLNQFKTKSGFKRLSNNVLELNKNLYYTNVLPNITNYYLTDKIDGQRCMLYCSFVNDGINIKLLSNNLYNIIDTNIVLNEELLEPDIILDCEFIYNKDIVDNNLELKDLDIFVFDIILYNKKNISKLPFEQRIKLVDDVNEFLSKYNLGKFKTFIKLTENYKQEIIDFYKSTKKEKYETDGLIFTPNSSVINENKKYINQDYINMLAYKWKPEDKITIDFYIAKSLSKNKKEYILCSGINTNDYNKLQIELIDNYYKIIPKKYHSSNYFPIPFTPSMNPLVYIYHHINNDDLTGKIGEFLYNKKENKWVLERIRTDRDIEVERGEYFGNAFKYAELNWLNIKNPLTIEDLIVDKKTGYFSAKSDEKYTAQRYFNSFVKTKIIESVVDNNLIDKSSKDWVIDLASGKGQDLARLVDMGFKNGLFVDNDVNALFSLIDRKHNLKLKTENSMNIYVKEVDLTTPYTKIIKDFSDIPLNSADIILCNFAIHYLADNEKNIKNIILLVYKLLKENGRFIFTCFNGEKVFNLLKDVEQWNIRENNILKYSIKKEYKSKVFTNNGQKIGVLLPFSDNEYYDEYLVNLNYLFNISEKQGLQLELSNSFSTMLDRFKDENRKTYNLLNDNDKEFVSLYQYNILKKTKVKGTNNLSDILQINKSEIQGKSEVNLILPIKFIEKCKESDKILFIIPIREDADQKQESKLLSIISNIKEHIHIDYNIYIIEQLYSNKFNQKKLYNIGFNIADTQNLDFDNVIFLDINSTYNTFTDNKHIYTKNCINPILINKNYIFEKNKFKLVNGFSNNNNKIIDRLNHYKIPLITSNINIIISKKMNYGNGFKDDGLNSLDYSIFEIISRCKIHRYIVDF